jgi:hypothetical protein
VSPMRAVMLATVVGMLAVSAGAKDNGKDGRKTDLSQNKSASPDWDRRTDTEWRRYTSGDVRRRTERMRGLDTDGDGVVSRSEWRGSERAFSRLDRDRDGALTARDRDVRRNTDRSTDRYTRRNDRFRVLDRNGDGIISQDEWNRR